MKNLLRKITPQPGIESGTSRLSEASVLARSLRHVVTFFATIGDDN